MIFIFDLGGVVVHNNDVAPKIAEMFGMTKPELIERFRPAFEDLCTGRATAEHFWDQVSRALGTAVGEDLWRTLYAAEPDRCVESLIRRLRESGSRVVAGTNTMDAHYRYHEARGELALFDHVYASHLIGYLKPDPDFFRHILTAEDVPPEAATFIDDMAENVRSARELGIRAIRFTECRSLRQALFRHNSGETRSG